MSARPETGAMRFTDDWSGVFLRGDDAIHYGMALKALLESTAEAGNGDVIARTNLSSLVGILLSCEHPPATFGQTSDFTPQQLKAFSECLQK